MNKVILIKVFPNEGNTQTVDKVLVFSALSLK
jgi:hypothetical protein